MRIVIIQPPRLYWSFINDYDNFMVPQAPPCLAAVAREAVPAVVARVDARVAVRDRRVARVVGVGTVKSSSRWTPRRTPRSTLPSRSARS